MKVHALTIADLAPLPRWVVWRNERRGKDFTKVPYCGKGKQAKADDSQTWITRTHAEVLLPRIVNGHGGGVGFELGDLGNGVGIGGVDLDTCRDGSGAIEPWALEVIDLFDTCTEVSPSGTGVKLFFQYEMKDLPALRSALGKRDGEGSGKKWARGKGRHAPSIELYLDGRYFAVTEQLLPTAPPELRPVSCDQLIRLISDLGPRFARNDIADAPKGGTDSTRSAAAFRKGA